MKKRLSFSFCLFLGHEGFLGFTVANEVSSTFGPGVRITYNRIITNSGGDFNIGTNEYICPVSGYYMFTVSSYAKWEQSGEIVLIHNDGSTAQALVTAPAMR